LNEAVVESSGLGEALRETQSTVTAFLERLVGEPLEARQRHHTTITSPASNELDVARGHPLLLRTAFLEGRASRTRYLYAETTLVPDRLAPTVRRRLEESTDPIGRVLDEAGLTITRQALGPPGGVSANGGVEPADCLLARRYRLSIDGSAVMVIAEWFLLPLAEFLVGD
jgi:chorismate-pyruvate lyase